MFLHVGIQGYFMSWTLNGDSILNIQRLEGRERVFSGKERSMSKGTKQGEPRRAGAQFGEKRKEDKKGGVRAEGADIQSHIKYSECCLSGKGEPLMFLLRS